MNLTSQCFTPTTFDLIKASSAAEISMTTYILNILKGMLMGAANVIPGVSGGTMALLTGIFERLINAIKAFDTTALKLALRFKFKELFEHIDLKFLSAIGIGVIASILTFAHLLKYLFAHHALYVWAFFFGLILASVIFVAKMIKRINSSVLILFIAGTAAAVTLTFTEQATENASIPYLLLCGAIAMCSMILPGLSGSYVLLLMGNYQLVMIESVSNFDFAVLIPVGIGAAAGLAAFARILAWIFKRFHDQTIALLTGFIFGSLSILWPWKTALTQTFQRGDEIKEKIVGFTDYRIPEMNAETVIAIAIMLTGIIAIVLIEGTASRLKND
jgi:putative membrane protein